MKSQGVTPKQSYGNRVEKDLLRHHKHARAAQIWMSGRHSSAAMSSSTIKPVSEQETAETKRFKSDQRENLFEIEDVNSRNKSQTPTIRSSIGVGRTPRKAAEKVRILYLMDEPISYSIHELLKQKTYVKGSTILFPNGPVEKMLFIVSGKIVSREEDGNEVILSEGDVCGEELVSWCLEQSPINEDAKKMRILGQKLVSNKLVSCITNVQAFSLRAMDIEVVINLYSREFCRILAS